MDKIGTLSTGIVIAIALFSAGALATYDLNNTEGPSISNATSTEATSTQEWACHSDGKLCPDGSVVGRSGPTCEFVACPSADATSTTATTYIGGKVTGLTITIEPKELISDSRCPQNVQCVWAGTVEIKTVLASNTGHGEHTLALGKPQTFGDYTVTLVSVTPEVKKAGAAIPLSSYRFTFEIQKH